MCRTPIKTLFLTMWAATVFAGPAGAADLTIVAVTSGQKNAVIEKTGTWSPFSALKLPALDKRAVINQRTEFYAILTDTTGELEGKTVTFYWYQGSDRRLFARPAQVKVLKWAAYPHAMAASIIWSDPSWASGMLSLVGLNSVSKNESWEKSRCYGPRTLRVLDENKKVVAERSFEIYQEGVRVY